MGKVSVVPVQAEVPGNASREVFQSLFKDLGKQAMALETILRAVCGRVDKMENWLTEVSFGMTELDLKLRNIAHNIDGTAAVDDEAQGPHRWAIPPPDDVKPLAPTVSKKLGNDKKAVRVTGMAAAILDRLATTSSAATPTAAETEKVEKASSKKKAKDKKHNNKKVKSNEPAEVAATPLPPAAERVELSESKVPTPLPAPQNVPVPAQSVVVEPVIMTPIPETLTKPVEQVTATHSNTVEEAQQVTIELPADEVPVIIDTQKLATNEERSESVAAPVKIEPIATFEPEIQDSVPSQDDQAMKETAIPALESDVPNGQSYASPKESNEVMPGEKIIESSVLVEEPRSADEIKSESHAVERYPTDEAQEKETSIPKDNESPAPHAVVENCATEPVAPMTPIAEKQTAPTGDTPASMTTTTKTEPTPQTINKTPSIPTASVSSLLPTVQVERTIEPFVLKAPPQPTIIASSALAAASSSELQDTPMKPAPMEPPSALNEDNMVEKIVSASKSTEQQNSSPPVHHSTTTATQPPATAVTKTIKMVGIPIRAFTTTHHEKSEPSHHSEVVEPIADPLLPRRTSAQRRSSKMVPRTSLTKKFEMSEDDAARRLSANTRGLHSRRTSVAPQAKVQEQEEIQVTTPQQVPQISPAAQAVQPEVLPPEKSAPTSSTEQVEVEEGSSDSSSESSSDGSGSSSSDEDLEDDAEAGAAVKDISKTMTALKKLKRAQMLSPEEEKELKERAHKKWFQLKGHIKEKQKKDVTNILLKRKKNVFTVSSRIELLEEKSREIFAALKQMTNEMREKNDRATHETLRRRVTDIEQSLLSVDLRIASLSSPVMDKVSDLESEVVSIRTTVQLQLAAAQSEATARHSLLEQAIASQRALVEALTQDIPTQLSAQTELFLEKLKQQPDYTAAIENLKRSLRRKADLKLLKELEARLLGLDAENEDCLVRCLSCRKEVTNLNNEKETDLDDQDGPNAGSGPSQLRKVNPGPSSARIYRSNVPFSAQPLVQESILEESAEPKLVRSQTLAQPQPTLFAVAEPEPHQQSQSAGDSHASEKPPAVRVPSVKWSTPPAEATLKRDVKSAKASPLSLMNITATRAILSPDRPISAPVVPAKKKAPTARSKSLLKSLTPQEQPPQ